MDNQNSQLSLASSIEAILFYTAEPMSEKKLAALTKTSIADIKNAVEELKQRLENNGGGIKLLSQNGEIVLGTTPLASSLIEQITRDEISKELSKASLETLSIICYKGPLTRSDIDYIRGVNSTFILRNLLVRGIIEKLDNPRDARASLYGATFAALEYMGVTKKEDLPKYEEVQAQLQAFLAEKEEDDSVLTKDKNEENNSNDSESESDESINSDFNLNEDSELEDAEIQNDEEGIENNFIDESSNELQDELETEAINEVEADVAEENIMSPEFDDAEIKEHLEDDIIEEKISNENN